MTITRTLVSLLCRHTAERGYWSESDGTQIERCTGCGARWVTFCRGTRVRAWWVA